MNDAISVELKELISLRKNIQTKKFKSKTNASTIGQHLTKIRGRGMEFSEVRNYQAGDEIRHMEWRVTARTGKAHIKLYEEERERPIILLIDFSPSMFFGTRICFKSVTAARLAALLAWSGLKNGDKVGGLVFCDEYYKEFAPKSNSASILPMLATISDLTKKYNSVNFNQSKYNLNDALCKIIRIIRPGSLVILISDLYQMDIDTEKHLTRIRKNCDILAYHICDKLELSPPEPERYPITNGDKELIIDTTLNAININYHDYFSNRMAKLKEQFTNLQIVYNCVTSETNLQNLINLGFIRNKCYV